MPLRLSIDPEFATQIGEDNLEHIRAAVEQCLSHPTLEEVVEIESLDAEAMQHLNAESRSIDEPTDVLTFGAVETTTRYQLAAGQLQSVPLASIAICPEKAAIYHESLAELVLHGLLHAYGLDHEAEPVSWHALEMSLITKLQSLQVPVVGMVAQSSHD
jgi:rRNA maturation RNase YbeY